MFFAFHRSSGFVDAISMLSPRLMLHLDVCPYAGLLGIYLAHYLEINSLGTGVMPYRKIATKNTAEDLIG